MQSHANIRHFCRPNCWRCVNALNGPVTEAIFNVNAAQEQFDQPEIYCGEDLKEKHEKETKTLKADNELAMKKKEFEITHNSDVRVKEAEDKVVDMEKKLAVAESENKMLREIADLNGDIIDIKELVTKLIDKLPEIKLSSLNVSGGSKKQD